MAGSPPSVGQPSRTADRLQLSRYEHLDQVAKLLICPSFPQKLHIRGARELTLGDQKQVEYLQTKDFEKALQLAFLRGGMAQKRAAKVKQVLGSLGDPNPFTSIPVTNHGETRIKHCVKYDLGDGWRLVTIHDSGRCVFLFVGDHDDTDRWLDSHRGETISISKGRLVRVPGVAAYPERSFPSNGAAVGLLDILPSDLMDDALKGLPVSLWRRLIQLDTACSPADIHSAVADVSDGDLRDHVTAVMLLLLAGNIDGAQAHIDLRSGRSQALGQGDELAFVSVQDGDEVRRLRVGSPAYERWLEAFEKRTTWHEWFLFLHPEQEKVVNADYVGAAQLSGVSGSGKTCVVVRRAMRLAESANRPVLLLTLNRSLAGLLQQLVDGACTDPEVRSRITVTSFFELASRLLVSFEPQKARHYEDVTWRLGEHVDEVFREFYRKWANNEDASVLEALQRSMNARGVDGETYLRDEFDWIRSAVLPESRTGYLEMERRGRKFGILEERRRDILNALAAWECKMDAVGVTDYLGLTTALSSHLDKIAPMYSHVLVDEAQDFGTTELRVVRRLVERGQNDIFLCGDVAQSILPKYRSLSEADIGSISRERIQQNYRNSREILKAAHALLMKNLYEEIFDSDGLEVLDPRYANFSGPAPSALAADSLEQEIAFARSYADTRLSQGTQTVCIAFAGYSARDIGRYAERCGVPALNGAYEPHSNPLVFSDLEQTKGYEFECLIVVNCSEGVLPARGAPAEEAYRDACKLYVTMTRAKRELVLSFHDVASPWLQAVADTIAIDSWQDFEEIKVEYIQPVPERLAETENSSRAGDAWDLTGDAFLYTPHALGLSLDAQEKLVSLVDGTGLRSSRGHRLNWRSMAKLLEDLQSSRTHDVALGPKVADELRRTLLPAWAPTVQIQ